MGIYLGLSVIIFVIVFFNILPKRGFVNAFLSGIITAILYPFFIVGIILYGIFHNKK